VTAGTGVGRPGTAAIAVALTGVLACATPGGDGIKSDLDDLQQQLWKVQKENAHLADALQQLHQPASDAASAAQGCGPGTGLAAMEIRLQAMERDLQMLRTRQDEGEERVGRLAGEIGRRARRCRAGPRASGRCVGERRSACPGYGRRGSDFHGAPTSAATEGPVAQAADSALASEDLYRRGYVGYTRGSYCAGAAGYVRVAAALPAERPCGRCAVPDREVHSARRSTRKRSQPSTR